VSYLPVTHSWYLSWDGYKEMARLAASAARARIAVETGRPDKAVDQAVQDMFRQLKIAAGLVNPEPITPEKAGISLVEIHPEFPIQPAPFRLCIDKIFLSGPPGRSRHRLLFVPSIDTPPPEPRAA
jgi:hypothetical protein